MSIQFLRLLVFGICLVSVTQGAVNGGIQCAACTIGVGLVEHLSIVHNESIEKALARTCNLLPTGKFSQACTEIVHTFGPWIATL